MASAGSGTTGLSATSGNAVNDGAWHTVALSYDASTTTARLFVDGALVDTLSNPTGNVPDNTTTCIGRFGTSYYWNGQIDEVAAYAGAKYTAAYTAPTAPTANGDTNLLALYHLDGDATDSYAPASGSFSASPPSLASGTSGNTVTLTGTGTAWASGTTFSVDPASALRGAAITAKAYNSATSVTLTVTAGTAGTITYSDSADSATATQTVSDAVTRQAVCDGNSLTSGLDAATSGGYPTMLAGYLGASWAVTNKGVSGQTTPEMSADAATDIDGLFNATAYTGGQALVAWEVTNDLYWGASHSSPASAATAYANYVAYCQARKAAGWRVVAVTVLPRSNSGTPADFETSRQAVNANIRAHWRQFADALADIAADARIGPAGSQTNATYYYQSGTSDSQVHLVDAGYAIVAQYVAAAVQQAINTGGQIIPVVVNNNNSRNGSSNFQRASKALLR